MASETQTRTFTVRFPDNLHQAVSASAAQQRKSLNALLQDLAETYLRQEEERRLFDSFTRLGERLEECNVEAAWEMQREAIELAELSQ